MAGKFTDVRARDLKKTLAQKLIPVADGLRDIMTRFGIRPYKVRIVRVRWAGGRRGVGAPVVKSSMDILPTPLVQDLATLAEVVQPIGLDEIGTILLSEVSGRFTDDQLRFLDRDGSPPEPDEEVFYEIEFPRVDGAAGVRRRFYLRSAPHYSASRFQWQLRLEKAHEDRDRQGDPQ